MRIFNDIIMNEIAAVADKTSEVVELGFVQDIAVQVIWTSSTCAGSIIIQCSNNKEDWAEISGSAITVNNNSDDIMISISDANYAFLRVFFDFTSGTLDTLKVIVNGKGM